MSVFGRDYDASIQWRVEAKKQPLHKYVSRGTYETRRNARYRAALLRKRDGLITRVVPVERGGK